MSQILAAETFAKLRKIYTDEAEQSNDNTSFDTENAYVHGLINKSNACYRNAVFQCLFSLRSVNNAVLDLFLAPTRAVIEAPRFVVSYCFFKMICHNHLSTEGTEKQKRMITQYLQKLWFNLWHESRPFYKKFLNAGMRHNEQADPHEFFLLFMDIINKDMREMTAVEENKPDYSGGNPISQSFLISLQREIVCLANTHAPKYKQTNEMCLSLPIPTWEKRTLNLYDCLNCFFSSESITNYRCSPCAKKVSIFSWSILSLLIYLFVNN